MTLNKTDRNAEICRAYQAGATMEEICRAAALTRGRVQQILRGAGLRKTARPKNGLSDRDEFLGINLTESVKGALREEAVRRGLSMSLLSSEVIEDMLKCLGYQVTA